MTDKESWKEKVKRLVRGTRLDTQQGDRSRRIFASRQRESPGNLSDKEARAIFQGTVEAMRKVANHPFFENYIRTRINQLLDNTSLVTDEEMAAYRQLYQEARSPGFNQPG